jgi:sec-independent protein translocase protein TatA
MLSSLAGPDILIIALIFVLLFGGSKIPGLAKGLGESIRNFKSAVKGDEEPEEKDKTKADVTK